MESGEEQIRKVIDLTPDKSYIEVASTTIPPRALLTLSLVARSSKYHSKKSSKASPLYRPLIRIPKEFAKRYKIPVVTDPKRFIEEWDSVDVHVSFGPFIGASL